MRYYLLDASAIVHYYVPSGLTDKVNKLVEQKQRQQSFLFVPIFCIAETYNTFAKYHYRQNKINSKEYSLIYEKFTSDIRRGKLFYQTELNRWHIMNVDYISPIEHTWFTRRPNKENKEEDWYLSTFDILFIATGIELARILGRNNLTLVTCDERIVKIGYALKRLDTKKLREFNIPPETPFPEVQFLGRLKI